MFSYLSVLLGMAVGVLIGLLVDRAFPAEPKLSGKKSPDYLKGWTDGYEVAYMDARSAREEGYAKGYADGQVELEPAKPKRVKKIRQADS